MPKTKETKKLYRISGYSYQEGYFVYCGELYANSEIGAKRLAAKVFVDGFGYADFLAKEITDVKVGA